MIKKWLSCALLSLMSFFSQAYCIDDWACFEKVRQGQSLVYWMSNNKPYPITSTLDVSTRNLKSLSHSKRQYSKTYTLGPYERVKVLTLSAVDSIRTVSSKENFYWTPGIENAQHNANYRYAKPFAEGQIFRVVQGFNGKYSHQGASRYAIDFAMPVGTPVHAAREGQVIDLQENHSRGGAHRRYAKYANFVTLLHEDGTTGEYYHLKHKGVVVSLGDHIQRGQLLGYSGNTGFSSMPHLHFAVYYAKSHGKYQSVPIKFSQ